MGKFFQMIGVLVGISLVSGLVLGGVNNFTKDKIERNTLELKMVPAVTDIAESISGPLSEPERQLLNDDLLSNYKKIDIEGIEGPLEVFPLFNKDKKLIALAFAATGEGGYGGDVRVMVGFDLASGNMAGIGIISHSETPGLGANIALPAWRDQFKGMALDSTFAPKKAGGDVDAVSGATRSTTAVSNAVGLAVNIFQTNKDKILAAFE